MRKSKAIRGSGKRCLLMLRSQSKGRGMEGSFKWPPYGRDAQDDLANNPCEFARRSFKSQLRTVVMKTSSLFLAPALSGRNRGRSRTSHHDHRHCGSKTRLAGSDPRLQSARLTPLTRNHLTVSAPARIELDDAHPCALCMSYVRPSRRCPFVVVVVGPSIGAMVIS